MRKKNPPRPRQQLKTQKLQARLNEAEDTLRAIRGGEVDSVVVVGPQGEQVRTFRGSEGPFRILVEAMNEGTVTLLRDGAVAYANSRFSEMVRMPLEQFGGSAFARFLPSEQQPLFASLLERSRKGSGKGEFTLLAADGSTLPAQLSVRALGDPEGRGFCLVITDLTELKRSEATLREREKDFRMLAESVPQLVWIRSPDGLNTYFNQRWVDYTGLSLEESCGSGWNTPFHPDDKQIAWRAWNHAVETGDMYSVECRLRGADGTYRYFITRAVPLRDATGNIAKWFGTCTDIDDIKRAEEALRDSEQRARAVAESVMDIIFEWDLKDQIEWQGDIDSLMGYVAGGFPRTFEGWKARLHPEDRERVGVAIQNHLKGTAPYNVECRVADKDDSWRWWSARGSVVRDAQGQPLRWLGALTDITERKQAEEAIAYLAAIVESSEDAIIGVSPDGVIQSWNRGAEKLFQYSAGEAIGRSISMLAPSDQLSEVRKILGGVKQGETIQQYEGVGLRKDGVIVPVSLTISPILDSRGVVVGASAIVRDFSERKRMEGQAQAAQAELRRLLEEAGRSRLVLLSVVEDLQQAQEAQRQSEDQLRLILDSTAEGIYGVDSMGCCTFCNASSLRMLGYSRPEDVIGQAMHALIHGRRVDGSAYPVEECPIHEAYSRGVEKHVRDDMFWRADGKGFSVEYWAYPIRPNDRTQGAVVAFLDITESKRAEKQLRHAAKMEAVGRLAGGVAHDFNNLLTIINGYTQLILEQCPAEHPNQTHLKEVLKAGNRAVGLTQQLLAFGRRQVLQPQVLNLNDAVQNTAKMLQRLIGEDINLVFSSHPTLGRVRADPGQVEQVVMNLAVNARDAMPQGGKLTIETADVELDEDYARSHGTVTPGHYVMLAVSDTGVGMDAETQAHIFEPFFTTKEKGKGTGLGLATVYGIINQSGGHIWVYSEPGKGTTFKIYLPRIHEAGEPARDREEHESVKGGSETILLVEDEEAVRALTARILQERGYNVIESSSAEDALQIAEGHQETIHMLLTDVVMPGMSGVSVAERVSALRQGVKILYMSGYTDDAIVRHGVLETGTAFLQKPFTPDVLARKVREVLDAGQEKVT